MYSVPPGPGSPFSDASEDTRVDHLWERIGWLVRLRWFAVVGVGVVVIAAHLLGAVATEVPLLLVASTLFVANVGFFAWARVDRRPLGLDRLERLAMTHLLVDVGALVSLLHWSDGIENPFSMFFAFLAAIAGKLLRAPRAVLVCLWAIAAQSTVVLLEHQGVLAHHPFFSGGGAGGDELIESPLFTAGYLVAFSVTMLGIAYFVTSATQRLHREWEQRTRLERVAALRERFAHLGELSAGVAHSIRNPLHGVLNCVDILRGQCPASAAPTLDLMEEGLRRMETITRRLLTFTREAPLHARSVDLRVVVQETLTFAGRPDQAGGGLPRTPVVLEPGPAVTATVDPDRLGEAVANVIDNAAHACRQGGRVEVSVLGQGGTATIAVRDSGAGIDPADLGHIFDPFFTTKAMGEGTGLGLAITRRIVEDHGGEVRVHSDASGTLVCLHLPLRTLERDVQ